MDTADALCQLYYLKNDKKGERETDLGLIVYIYRYDPGDMTRFGSLRFNFIDSSI